MNKSPKLLAVDDEPFNIDIMRRHLTKAGYDVIEAEDGVAALQRLEENLDIDVIVLDRMMPRMDGMEFIGVIKADARFKDIPVVMQTAAAMTKQVLEGIQAGVQYYLTKPYKQNMLISIVDSALRDAKNRNKLREEVKKGQLVFGLMKQSIFQFRTIDEASAIAFYIANCFPEPQQAAYGLNELLLNAVEHGNLGITYEEKTNLVLNGIWQNEIERRLNDEQYRYRLGSLAFAAEGNALVVRIKDEGNGFDWKKYIELSPERVTDPNGRGIATSRMVSFHSIEYIGAGNEVVCTFNLNQEKCSSR